MGYRKWHNLELHNSYSSPNIKITKCMVIWWGYWAGCYSDDVLDLYLGGAQFRFHPRFLTVMNEVFIIFLQSLKANVRLVAWLGQAAFFLILYLSSFIIQSTLCSMKYWQHCKVNHKKGWTRHIQGMGQWGICTKLQSENLNGNSNLWDLRINGNMYRTGPWRNRRWWYEVDLIGTW